MDAGRLGILVGFVLWPMMTGLSIWLMVGGIPEKFEQIYVVVAWSFTGVMIAAYGISYLSTRNIPDNKLDQLLTPSREALPRLIKSGAKATGDALVGNDSGTEEQSIVRSLYYCLRVSAQAIVPFTAFVVGRPILGTCFIFALFLIHLQTTQWRKRTAGIAEDRRDGLS